ncbi:MAG: transposase [Pseudomonadota bacterium]
MQSICEYDRKHAIRLLNRKPQRTAVAGRKRQRKYGEDVEQALIQLWYAANQICSKRLVPLLPALIANLERHQHIELRAEVRMALLGISPASVDRRLRSERKRLGKSVSTTRAGDLLKHQIRIRTFADWDDATPGFFEADLVAHCGGDTRGSYLNTLVLIDVPTGWLEFLPLLQKSGGYVIEGLNVARRLLPFPLLGLDTDNGSEFINQEVIGYCQKGDITFTRSRAYKKNDQAYVEEKNGSVVRRMIGYDRYEGREAWRTLGELYRQLRLYVNYFQPSLKLLEKKRDGSHVSRRYEVAKTAYQRILESDIEKSIKRKLTSQYEMLDAVDLLCRIQSLQARLRSHAVAVSSTPPQEDTLDKIQHFSRQGKKDGRKGPHHWRTRRDPFEDVKDLIDCWLTEDPHRPAASVLRELIERNPDRFRQGHTRSIQRRVNEWRENNADKMTTLDHVMLESDERETTEL